MKMNIEISMLCYYRWRKYVYFKNGFGERIKLLDRNRDYQVGKMYGMRLTLTPKV